MMAMGRSALPVLSFHPSTLAVFRRLVLRTTMKSFACFFACNHKLPRLVNRKYYAHSSVFFDSLIRLRIMHKCLHIEYSVGKDRLEQDS